MATKAAKSDAGSNADADTERIKDEQAQAAAVAAAEKKARDDSAAAAKKSQREAEADAAAARAERTELRSISFPIEMVCQVEMALYRHKASVDPATAEIRWHTGKVRKDDTIYVRNPVLEDAPRWARAKSKANQAVLDLCFYNRKRLQGVKDRSRRAVLRAQLVDRALRNFERGVMPDEPSAMDPAHLNMIEAVRLAREDVDVAALNLELAQTDAARAEAEAQAEKAGTDLATALRNAKNAGLDVV